MKKIGVLTAGGDCPGLNVVLRGIMKTALNNGIEVVGFRDGYKGLLEGDVMNLNRENTSGLIHRGGTILGASNKTNTFAIPEKQEDGSIIYVDKSDECAARMKDMGLDCLIVIGGDGSLKSARDYGLKGINVIGVPKTIDNDIVGTDITFGFNSAVTTATEAIDKLHTTAASHDRVLILEVMGRDSGFIALESGVAGGADVILIPEIPYDIEKVVERIETRRSRGRNFSIVVVAEGAKPIGGDVFVKKIVEDSPDQVRLGGVGNQVAEQIEKRTGMETRATVLGYMQRGGSPTAYDRVLSTLYGSTAVELAMQGKFNVMVAMKDNKLTTVDLDEVAGKDTAIGAPSSNRKGVALDSDLLLTARRIGIGFGDDK